MGVSLSNFFFFFKYNKYIHLDIHVCVPLLTGFGGDIR